MSKGFKLDAATGYFKNVGVDVMAFDDFYPEGHQSGVSIIMHGNRIASNGDVRYEKTDVLPPRRVPKQGERHLCEKENTIATDMCFSEGPKPINYKVTVKGEGPSVIVTVDFEQALTEENKLCFNLELFPGALFGKPWLMDDDHGVFPPQPNCPDTPYAIGRKLVVQPGDPLMSFTIESKGAPLRLIDGRMNDTAGWFKVSSEISNEAPLQWVITPNVVEDWMYTPVVQVSQVGYHPEQQKMAIIELDNRETNYKKAVLYKMMETGEKEVLSFDGKLWGQFLRYNYLKFDFTDIKEEGLYKLCYGQSKSSFFRIAQDVYDRGVWQPVLEYFLPVQMCHMRVTDSARIWHGLCHMDDAQMAPVDHLHFDGYVQGPSTLTQYKPGDIVPGLNVGGWHDAGDDDLRIESQAGEIYILAMAYEAFGVNLDVTTVDQEAKVCKIHVPDGKNDILQQIEHGLLSVVGAYRALGRLYRGIITNSMKEYVMMGDFSAQTDNVIGNEDDRWVFTEENPQRELTTAAQLAAASRTLRGFNDELSDQTLEAACSLYKVTDASGSDKALAAKLHAASELFLTTGADEYKAFLLSKTEFIVKEIENVAWFLGRAEKAINDTAFTKAIKDALPRLKDSLITLSAETPYGIPYRPHIWGAGWSIQRLGFEYYFLNSAYPDIFGPEMIFDSLNFILGCHPGSNNASFASGVGTKSLLVAYGHNRADWSFIPGGVASGTALIRPDFPELLDFPFLWQQTEYVLGGGSSHYMFLVLAAQHLLDVGNLKK